MVFYNFSNKDIIFGWVPSYIGIMGNEKEDSAGKSALDLPRVKVALHNTDFKHHINQYILSTCQDDSHGVILNKLHSVKPVVLHGTHVRHTPFLYVSVSTVSVF